MTKSAALFCNKEEFYSTRIIKELILKLSFKHKNSKNNTNNDTLINIINAHETRWSKTVVWLQSKKINDEIGLNTCLI